MGEKKTFRGVGDMPPMAVSSQDMSFNQTGTWRNVRPVIDFDTCIYCNTCWQYCPEPAISLEEIEVKGKIKGKPLIDYDICKGCGICWHECPVDAIQIEEEEK